jgi:tRNA nucleotidyltransferase/poly(A) polymerase
LRDIGHSLAMFLERQYKDAPDFLSLMKSLAKVKNREIMRPIAYLLPPKQRILARFMNLTPCLQWAKKMLFHFDKLSKEERRIFKFLKKYRKQINELNEIIGAFNQIAKILKANGLSEKKCQYSKAETVAFDG